MNIEIIMCDEWITGLYFLAFSLTGAAGMLFILKCLGYFEK
jgi:hypothetical protein